MRSEGTAGSGPDGGSETVIAGRYRLRRQLGRGGMGVVWEALDTSLDRKVAVKGLLYPGAADSEAQSKWVSRARREAQAIARIGHQNVVAVHDVIEDGNQVWIVMELFDSRSLADLLLEQRQLSVPQAARIGLQVLRGLAAVHEAGVLHRDVKPHNILFRPDGRALLMDFGIATFEGATQVTRPHEIIGTAQYLAPELLTNTPANQRPASTASDLWSLGVTLYEMVEGRRPFDGAGSIEVLVAVREAPVPPMRYAGPLTGLIEALLQKDPGQRPDAAEAERMLQAVTEDVAALTTPAVRSGATPREKPAEPVDPARNEPVRAGRPDRSGGRRGRWKAVAAVVVCMALLAGGTWFTWRELHGTGKAPRPGKVVANGGSRFSDTHGLLKVGVKADQPGLSERVGKGDTKNDYKGFEVDLALRIAKQLDFRPDQVRFYPVTSENRDGELRVGDVDVVLATYSIDNPSAKNDGVAFAGPYLRTLGGLLVRKNRKYHELGDLQADPRARVCTATNSVYVQWLKDHDLGDRTQRRDGYERCVEDLLNRHSPVDAVATDDVIVAGLAHKYQGTEALSSFNAPQYYGVAMEGDAKGLKQEVCQALSTIMRRPSPKGTSPWAGSYDSHLSQYTHQPAPEEPPLTSC